MKRFVIFTVFGPPLGLLAFGWVVIPVYEGHVMELRYYARVLTGIPFSYIFGVVPAGLTAGVDWLVSRSRWRVVVCFLFGVAVSVPIFKYALPFQYKNYSLWAWPIFAAVLVGGIPAVACSWMTAAIHKWVGP
jgi:hypothetical protein